MHDSRMTCPAPCVYHWGNKKKKRERAKDYQIQANKAQRDKIRSLYHLCDMLPFAETMSVSGREMKCT